MYNDCLLEKCDTIWNKDNADVKKEFDSKSAYNKESFKTKIQPHSNEDTGFYNKKIPKVDPNKTCLAVISLDSAFKKDVN